MKNVYYFKVFQEVSLTPGTIAVSKVVRDQAKG